MWLNSHCISTGDAARVTWLMLLVACHVSSDATTSDPFTTADLDEIARDVFGEATTYTPPWSARKVIAYKENAAVFGLMGESESDTLMGFAKFGSGRIVAISDQSFLKYYTIFEQGCKDDNSATGYSGTHAKTKDGFTCQAWTATSPHDSQYKSADQFPDATMADASNYCRNPNGDSYGPWCYTTNPAKKYQYCLQIKKCSEQPPEDHMQLMAGVTRWLARHTASEPYEAWDTICVIAKPDDTSCLDDSNTVIAAYQKGHPADPVLDAKMAAWIKAGGSFVFAHNLAVSNPFTDILFYNVITEAGLVIVPIPIALEEEDNPDEQIKYDSSRLAVADWLQLNIANYHVNNISHLEEPYIAFVADSLVSLMKTTYLNWELRKEIASYFLDFLEGMESNVTWPVCDMETKVYDGATDGILRLFQLYASLGFLGLWDKKAPNVDRCPGDLEDTSAPRVDAIVEVNTTESMYWATKHYLVAGESMNVEILSTDNPGWSFYQLHVGMHTDSLGLKNAPWKRYPIIAAKIRITDTNFVVHSPFGGLVVLKSLWPGQERYVRLKLSGVVKAAHYKLGDADSRNAWLQNRFNPAPWGELEGEKMTFYMKRDNLITLDDLDELDAALRLWDETVTRSQTLSGRPLEKQGRMSIIPDLHITIGYMHSGNPIMDTKKNYMDLPHDSFQMNTTGRHIGFKYWGYYHEIGHNCQKSEWTFEGFTEVTVNIFSMLSKEFTGGGHPWLDVWNSNRINIDVLVATIKEKQYESSSHTTSDGTAMTIGTISSPWIGLVIYSQFVTQFGWRCLKEIFDEYEYHRENDKDLLPGKENLSRLNQWVVRMSLRVGYNMCPLFDLWSYPVTVCTATASSTDDALTAKFHADNLTPYLPTDHVSALEGIEDRIKEIEDTYPGILRELTDMPQCYTPSFVRKEALKEKRKASRQALKNLLAAKRKPSVLRKLSRMRKNMATRSN